MANDSPRVRVGVIGVGSMGRNHARVYSELPDVELVGVSDADKERCEDIAGQFSTTPYTDYRELLDKGLDAVNIALPTGLHREAALAAIETGAHILVEKPLAESLESAREIYRQATEKGLKLLTGHIERFNPAVVKISEVIKEGKLGELLTISTLRAAPNPKRITDTGIILDLACHDIDVLSSLFDSRVSEVFTVATGIENGKERAATITMSYPGGKCGISQTNWLVNYRQRKLVVVGSEATVLLDYIQQSLVLYGNEGVEVLPVEKGEPLKHELSSFVNLVRDGGEPLVSGEDSIHNLAVSVAAIKSWEEGRLVRISGEDCWNWSPEVIG